MCMLMGTPPIQYAFYFCSEAVSPTLSVPPPVWYQRCRSWSGQGQPWPSPVLGRAAQRSRLWPRRRAVCSWSPDRCSPRRPPQGHGAAQADPQLSNLPDKYPQENSTNTRGWKDCVQTRTSAGEKKKKTCISHWVMQQMEFKHKPQLLAAKT